MPLYDCLLLIKSSVQKQTMMDLLAKVGKRVYQRKGVVTDIRSMGTVTLGYGIKKLDGRHFKGQLMQMTFMVPPSFNQELQYLNKEDRLLRWLVVKHRPEAVYGREHTTDGGADDFRIFRDFSKAEGEDDDDDDDEDDEDEDDDNWPDVQQNRDPFPTV